MQEYTITFESGNRLLKILQNLRTNIRDLGQKDAYERSLLAQVNQAIKIVIGEDRG